MDLQKIAEEIAWKLHEDFEVHCDNSHAREYNDWLMEVVTWILEYYEPKK